MIAPSAIERLVRTTDAAVLADLVRALSPAEVTSLLYDWDWWARAEQRPPPGDWAVWLMLGGRGFGKTRAGAEWVHAAARTAQARPLRIALVGATLAEARAVMVEGDSGLLNVGRPGERPKWEPALRRLRWPGGAEATLYSAAEPEMLRGPQHGLAWCDEVAKWGPGGDAAWDNLMLGLRLGERPRVLATTTPRRAPLLQRIMALPGLVTTGGSSAANRHNLAARFLTTMDELYGGTRLARQELDGEMLAEVEGTLWPDAVIAAARATGPVPDLIRVVVGVDPPASEAGDACGIVVAGRDAEGTIWVLDDASLSGASPERWARAVGDAAARHGADAVVAEANNGGDMVAAVLRSADAALPLRLVHASRGKVARAEPVALRYAAGRVRHVRAFPALEAELAGFQIGGGYAGPGRSPDRADALVWAISELMRPGAAARVRTLAQGGG